MIGFEITVNSEPEKPLFTDGCNNTTEIETKTYVGTPSLSFYVKDAREK